MEWVFRRHIDAQDNNANEQNLKSNFHSRTALAADSIVKWTTRKYRTEVALHNTGHGTDSVPQNATYAVTEEDGVILLRPVTYPRLAMHTPTVPGAMQISRCKCIRGVTSCMTCAVCTRSRRTIVDSRCHWKSLSRECVEMWPVWKTSWIDQFLFTHNIKWFSFDSFVRFLLQGTRNIWMWRAVLHTRPKTIRCAKDCLEKRF